jgi:hypothetical protein
VQKTLVTALISDFFNELEFSLIDVWFFLVAVITLWRKCDSLGNLFYFVDFFLPSNWDINGFSAAKRCAVFSKTALFTLQNILKLFFKILGYIFGNSCYIVSIN